MTLVFAAYVPNAPFLIAPDAFEGVGQDAVRSLRDLRVLERFRPDVVVVSSPHWVTADGFRVSVDPHPRQVYDFSGFPPALSEVRYAPPGSPSLAARLVESGQRAGIRVEGTTEWGLDHGAWAPLMHLVPGGRVPVVPVSIRPDDPALHVRWGASMRSVLEDPELRAVFVATGSILHNFGRMGADPHAPWPEGERVEAEIVDRVLALDPSGLAAFDRRGWRLAQPEGNLGPLFTLLGLVGKTVRGRRVSSELSFGAFSLTTIEFVPHSAAGVGAPGPRVARSEENLSG